MAPRVPDEIDVFTGPHSRMKELVNIYREKVQCTDFRDGPEVISLLHDLDLTLNEFKCHESIENIYIMEQLKDKLKQRQITNAAVCDCHNDNRLAEMVQLVQRGCRVRQRSIKERISFGLQLQQAFNEFVSNFLPHMEEEEQVFQPMLVEYFEYDELKILKEVVQKEHELVKELQQTREKAQEEEPETAGVVKDLRDLDLHWDPPQPWHVEEEELYQDCQDSCLIDVPPELNTGDLSVVPTDVTVHLCFPSRDVSFSSPGLPAEVLVEIFQYLTVAEVCRCAQVCQAWNTAAYSPGLWTALYPVQWARGVWVRGDAGLAQALEEAAHRNSGPALTKWDEDADVDEAEQERDPVAERERHVLESLVRWVVPRVGAGVARVVVDGGRALDSRLLHQLLVLCPNLTALSAAHTLIHSYTFKGLCDQGGLRKLRHLDLQGCELIDDTALHYIAWCRQPPTLAPCLPRCVGMSLGYLAGEDTLFLAGRGANYGYDDGDGDWCREGEDTGGCSHWYGREGRGICHCSSLRSVRGSGKGHSSTYRQSLTPHWSVRRDWDIEEALCYRSISPPPHHSHSWPAPCSPAPHRGWKEGSGVSLVELSLSGCWQVTDKGLLALALAGALHPLTSLDVSGCYRLTAAGLTAAALHCPALQPHHLWYCDNILDGPHPTLANGCNNLANPVRACCRTGL